MNDSKLQYVAASDAPPTVRGKVIQKRPPGLVLALPGTDYRLHLVLEIELPAGVGERVEGTVHAVARRVDVVPAGGCYVEPVFGRPRRVQGRLVGGHAESRVLYVQAACPMVCLLSDRRQQVADFAMGQLVSFDVEPGAVFKPVLR